MDAPSAKPDSAMPFEDALDGLELIIREMQTGEQGLLPSIEAYERGVAFQKICEKRLNEAEGRIDEVRRRSVSDDPADLELVTFGEPNKEAENASKSYSSTTNNDSDHSRERSESSRDDSKDDGELF